jgi:molybdate transport system permease protein
MAETQLTRAQPLAAPQIEQPSRRKVVWLLIASLPMLAFLLLPLLALLLRISPAQLLANLGNPEVVQAIGLSVVTTAITVVVTLLAGTPLAFLLARGQFRGRTALETLIDLPMVLPPSVAGIALLVAFGRRGLLGQYLTVAEIELAFTSTAVVLAQVFVAAPFYIKAAAAGFAGVDRELEHAAALDGASSLQVGRYVTVPLAWTSLLGGAVMTWARALGEFGATIIFAGNFVGRTQTMPLAIYQGFEQELSVALTLSVILLLVSFGVLFVVRRVLRQQL